jgi:hypothetical protein
MRCKTGRSALLLSPLLLVAACASAEFHGSNRQVANRLQVRLRPDIAAGSAQVQRTPGSARVTIADQSLFPKGGTELDDNGRLILARVIEGLLDPHIMRVDVMDSPTAPGYVQSGRVEAVRQFFRENGLGAALPPPTATVAPAGAAPQQLTITVSVVWS